MLSSTWRCVGHPIEGGVHPGASDNDGLPQATMCHAFGAPRSGTGAPGFAAVTSEGRAALRSATHKATQARSSSTSDRLTP